MLQLNLHTAVSEKISASKKHIRELAAIMENSETAELRFPIPKSRKTIARLANTI